MKPQTVDDMIESLVPEHKQSGAHSTRKHVKTRTNSVSIEAEAESLSDLDLEVAPDEDEVDEVDSIRQFKEEARLEDYPTKEWRSSLSPFVLEYFGSADSRAFYDSVKKVEETDLIVQACILAIEISMTKHNKERELVSCLLVDLVSDMGVSRHYMERAFDSLLTVMPELVLDIPTARPLLSYFLARAAADEVVRPKFLTKHLEESEEYSVYSVDICKTAHCLAHARHGLVLLENIWGGRLDLGGLMRNINDSLKEYLSNSDINEAEKDIHDLDVPHFLHEYVYEAITFALEGSASDNEKIHTLLKSLSDHVVVTEDQIIAGFTRIRGNLDELKIDCPTVVERFAAFCDLAKEKKYLPASF